MSGGGSGHRLVVPECLLVVFKLVYYGSFSQNLLEPLAHACDMCGYIKVHPQYGYPVGSRYSLSLPSFMVHSAAVSALGCTEHAPWCLITRVLMKARIRNIELQNSY